MPQTNEPTNAELDRFGNKIMGHIFDCHETPFTPSTKIDQAIECAFKKEVELGFMPQANGSIYLNVDHFLIRAKSLSDCARQIMLTLWEMEVEGG